MVSRLFSSATAKPFKLYTYHISQPCRALEIYFKINQIPYEPVIVNLGKRENMTEEFGKVTPFKKVPVIDDGGFVLTESIAIFRYITGRHKVADHWYPKDDVKRALVDEYLEWQHIGLRAPCALYVWAKFFTPNITGKPTDANEVQSRMASMEKACDDLNNIWLKNKPYVSGKEISFADILAACELEELALTNYDPIANRPKIAEWLDRVKSATNPHYDEVHAGINKLAKKISKASAKL